MLLVHLLDEGVHRLQVLDLPNLVVIFLNVNQLLLSAVFLVKHLRVGVVHEVVTLGGYEDAWDLYVVHLLD